MKTRTKTFTKSGGLVITEHKAEATVTVAIAPYDQAAITTVASTPSTLAFKAF